MENDRINEIAALNLSFAVARVISRREKLRQFVHDCPTHGRTLFNTRSGFCQTCRPVNLPGRPGDKLRTAARNNGLLRYRDYCPAHGETDFSVAHGKCLTCFTTAGAPRSAWTGGRPHQTDNPLAAARREGRLAYTGECEVHGATAYSVAHGKCLTCFTAAGVVRHVVPGPGARRQADNPRAAARREGLTCFEGECATHGATAHSVASGRCLTCFTAAGARRRDRPEGSARVLARREGLTAFEGVCVTHGKTPHSVSHGGCLTCFTANGSRRRWLRVD